MAARAIDGKAVATEVRAEVAKGVAEFADEAGRAPGLATVIVGDDPASKIYVDMKHKACREAGMDSAHHGLGAETSEDELLELVGTLNRAEEIDGILVQLPLPDQIDPVRIVTAIDAGKDVDGLSPTSAGLLAHGVPGFVPCTPAGVMELLRREEVERLLLSENATVTMCHSRTRDLNAVCRRADVLVAAAGVPRLLGADAVKPGAIVIDVGVNRDDDGLCGDVDFEAVSEVAAAITPVPGGVGPMTIAMLLANTLAAARAHV
jgi:methylenetetrahydrofolate dehydrogenase (NADP+)/methenyltetrahydrofolate cyclohydrolase